MGFKVADEIVQFIQDNSAVTILVVVVLSSLVVSIIGSMLKSDSGKPKELRHLLAYIFAGGCGVMLFNSVILFNMYAFAYKDGKVGFWSAALMFIGSLICAGAAAAARYCDDTPAEIAKKVGEELDKVKV